MNGAGVQKAPAGHEARRPSSNSPSHFPAGKMLVESYTSEMGEGDKPLYNPMNPDHPQSSVIVDLKDPIQVHLLTETALSDSKEYEILSQEEVDDLKKQIQSLSQRVEQTKANLAIQAKYRDAAISMAKLYSPTGPKRRSLLGNRLSGGDSAREADVERQASERRCEELAAELFSLEKRLMVPQRRLLRHTAGILQMTHRASTKAQKDPTSGTDARPNLIPGSPESLYTYSNGRNSLEPAADDFGFDDASLYLPLDAFDGQQPGRTRNNAIQIPTKSPGREQNQLREETDRLRQENTRLLVEIEELRNDGAERVAVLSETERKMEDLNNNLRELIIRSNPTKYSNFQIPPPTYNNGRGSGLEPGDLVGSQLTYLGNGLAAALEEQNVKDAESARGADAETVATKATLAQAEGIMQTLNRQVSEMLQARESDYPSPPDSSESRLEDQLDYLQDAVATIQTEMSRAAEISSSSSANKQKTDRVETVLTGLWDIIQAGYADIQHRKAERRKVRADKGLDPDEEDMSADEAIDPDEPYSLQAFSAKVQWLYAQATSLKDQKSVLKRQIKQQRELNNKSSSEKDKELMQATEELKTTRSMLDSVEQEAKDAQEKLAKALRDLDIVQQTSANNESASYEQAREQLMERDNMIAQLQENGEELRKELSRAEDNVTLVGGQLEDALRAKNLAETRMTGLEKELKEKDEELERMNGMIIELKTEATIAKAELEGAYGSRAQRAAEVAKVTQNAELTELTAQNQKLRKELENTLKELELITKETIAATKEKLDIEGQLDDAVAAQTNLEGEVDRLRDKLNSEVSKLQEQLDAEKLKVPPSPGVNGAAQSRAGAAMLSEQFRATMKEERRKFQDEMKEEQAKRRKLEDELRALRRTQGPGKSPLGPLSPRS
ncbi:Up-regulated during septation-domain-containing protein [Coniochaeta sp. 2T2.1]|nr:Up-regulated during septation-domain-containing protein [Coniochaeta sp. 2T2.1]